MTTKKAVLLVNVGTPDASSPKAVRHFLFQFLNDRYVIDIPWLLQKILVNFIIIPFRVKKSTKLYQKLWTKNGSPLLLYLNKLVEKLNNKSNSQIHFFGAMRYGNPSLKSILNIIKKNDFTELVVLPLYPQYATSTTLTTLKAIQKHTQNWQNIQITFIDQFYSSPHFITAFSEKIKSFHPEKFDHIIFTYHGLPNRQVDKIHKNFNGSQCQCEKSIPEGLTNCYKAHCYETTKLLAESLHLTELKYSIGFQSRLSKNWLSPFTDELITQQAQLGNKNILVVSPSFVADCLETIVEISIDYQKLFIDAGGDKLQLVESLNADDNWATSILNIIDDAAS